LFYARYEWNPLRNPLGAARPWSCRVLLNTTETP
jgi:hypothetical protein